MFDEPPYLPHPPRGTSSNLEEQISQRNGCWLSLEDIRAVLRVLPEFSKDSLPFSQLSRQIQALLKQQNTVLNERDILIILDTRLRLTLV